MHTLAELNPAVGDTVTLTFYASPEDYLVEDIADREWKLKPLTVKRYTTWWTLNGLAAAPHWTLKPQPKELMKTLSELNLKVGDTVQFWGQNYDKRYRQEWEVEVVGTNYWDLRSVSGSGLWTVNQIAKEPLWTLKQEKPVTVADLNLRVGDRIRSGDRTGTYLGKRLNTPYDREVEVVWDWGCRFVYVPECQVDWTLIPKPEPTLTSLGLKVGDPVYFPTPNRCGLVKQTDGKFAYFTDHKGEEFSYCLSSPAFLVQKLEVPK